MKKCKIILLAIIMILTIGATYVFAEETTNSPITIEGEEIIAPGGTSTLNVKLSSEETIGLVSGKIAYESNINSIEVLGKNNWTIIYNDKTGIFVAYKAEGAKEEEIMEIQYEVSSSEGVGTITISEIEMITIDYNTINLEDIITNITIKKQITAIEVTNPPTKTKYIEGESFDKSGMVVKVTYNDGSTKNVTNYTVTDKNNLTVGKEIVEISYTENGVTKTTTQRITVESKLNITINKYETTQENEIKYIEGAKPETTIQGVLNDIDTNGTASVYKGSTKITDKTAKAGTGMILKITLGTQEETYTLVVTGDLNGDGEMGNIDLLKLVRYNAGLEKNLSGAYLKATDVYKDGNYADNKDILKTARVLAGLENL